MKHLVPTDGNNTSNCQANSSHNRPGLPSGVMRCPTDPFIPLNSLGYPEMPQALSTTCPSPSSPNLEHPGYPSKSKALPTTCPRCKYSHEHPGYSGMFQDVPSSLCQPPVPGPSSPKNTQDILECPRISWNVPGYPGMSQDVPSSVKHLFQVPVAQRTLGISWDVPGCPMQALSTTGPGPISP